MLIASAHGRGTFGSLLPAAPGQAALAVTTSGNGPDFSLSGGLTARSQVLASAGAEATVALNGSGWTMFVGVGIPFAFAPT